MPQIIPIQATPSQYVTVVLGGQNCQIAIYQKNQGMFVDVNANGIEMAIACLAHNAVPLVAQTYNGFIGQLYFIDIQAEDDPYYTGLGSRFMLVYLDAAEYLLAQIPNPEPTSSLNLLATDQGILIYTVDGRVIEVIL